MKNSLISLSVVFIFVMPQVSAESLFDKIKRKADEIIAEQEAKADQKIDQTIDETVDSAEETVYGEGETTTSNTGTGASTSQTVVTGDNGNPMLVKMTQTELKRLGYSVSVDGVYGPGTRNAIMAFEADSGRQLTGNVSPDLINALKGTATSGGAGNTASTPAQTATVQPAAGTQHTSQSVSNASTAAGGQGQMQKLYNDCKTATPVTQQTGLCIKYCLNAARSEMQGHEVPENSRNYCVSFHQAAMGAEASHGALEPYINEMRALGAKCQSISGDEKKSYAKSCASRCKKSADLVANQQVVNETAIDHAKHRLKQCKQSHEMAMDVQ